MENHYIPGTNVRAHLIEPTPTTGYVSIFQKNDEIGDKKNEGSVNAGTSNAGSVFAVGLGGINGAFANQLGIAGQNVSLYQTIHQSLYNLTNGVTLSAFSNDFTPSDPVLFSMVQRPNPSDNLPQYDGVVFIDVFNPKQVPNKNSRNYSMLYVVPPNRENYSSNAQFLKAVEVTNVTLSEALVLYNVKHAAAGNPIGLQPIHGIRMCLFSGSIYRGNAPQPEVAKHNLKGLETGLNNGLSEIERISFENSYDDSTRLNVFDAIKKQLSDKPNNEYG